MPPFGQSFRLHRLARIASQENRQVLIGGNPGHPEVIGIMGECSSPAILLHSQQEARDLEPDNKAYTLVAQTTFAFREYRPSRPF